MQLLDDQLDCQEIVKVVITDVFRAFDNKLQENELSKLEIPTAVALAMAKMEAVVKLATLRYDGDVIVDTAFETMEPDQEPVPAGVDSWARGTGNPTSLHPIRSITILFFFHSSVYSKSCT